MNSNEMLERIFNYVEDLSSSEVDKAIDSIFIREDIETPFGIATIHKRKSSINLIKKTKDTNASL